MVKGMWFRPEDLTPFIDDEEAFRVQFWVLAIDPKAQMVEAGLRNEAEPTIEVLPSSCSSEQTIGSALEDVDPDPAASRGKAVIMTGGSFIKDEKGAVFPF